MIFLYLDVAIAGAGAAIVGQIVPAIALVREPGVSREVGVLFILGVGAIVFSTQAAATSIGAIATLGGAVGWAGLGFLVFRREAGRSA